MTEQDTPISRKVRIRTSLSYLKKLSLRAVAFLLVLVIGAVLGRSVEIPTERIFDDYFPPPVRTLDIGIRQDALTSNDAMKVRLLNRTAPTECNVFTFEVATSAGDSISGVELTFLTDKPILAHRFPLGYAIRDMDGQMITERFRQFAHEKVIRFMIGTLSPVGAFRAYIITPKETKLEGYCKYEENITGAGSWKREVAAPNDVLSEIRYDGFTP